jgi:hypothetical protein
MVMQEGVVFDQIDDSHENLEKAAIPKVVEGLKIVLDIRQLHQIDDSFRRFKDLLLDADSVHVKDAGKHAIGDQFFIGHHFGAVECGEDINKQFASSCEISDNKSVDAFVDFEFVLTFPVSSLLEEFVALIDIFLDLVVIFQFEVDADQFERDVHLLSDFDGALES